MLSPSPTTAAGVAPLPSTSASPTAGDAEASTPPSTPVATATEVAMTSPKPFTLTSSAFDDGAPIPRAATCDGADRSPALDWTGAPAGTQALALVVIDPDARDFVHWVAFDMTGAPDGHLAAGLDASANGPRPGPERLRQARIRRPVPAVGATSLLVHTLRARSTAGDRRNPIAGRGQGGDERARARRDETDGDLSAVVTVDQAGDGLIF